MFLYPLPLNIPGENMLYLTNSLITPFRGVKATFREKRISIDEAKELILKNRFVSAIGHESTARILSNLLGVEIQVNRQQVFMEPGDKLIAFIIKARLPEGKVLTEDEIKTIGYEFILVERVE